MTTAQQHVDPDLIDRDDINEYGSSTTPVVLGLAQIRLGRGQRARPCDEGAWEKAAVEARV